jgi:4-hydroxybenzoate polyprenyltransferase
MEGDRKEHAITLPIKYGVMPTLVLATASLIVLISATIAVATFALYHSAFLYIVLVADCLMCASIILIWRDHSQIAVRRVSTILKISMTVGLISIIVGSI